tara:strand:- start:888 stop:1535 length:648 start_codon:yes stop_codon:yes gene_type:complete
MKHEFIYLGQSIVKVQVPVDIFNIINHIYETKFKNLPSASTQLVGKIKNEHSLFYSGENEMAMKRHSFLPRDVLVWFKKCYEKYLEVNKTKESKMELRSIWVNEMKEHEYNPVHIHSGDIQTGLSSVMILKLPKSFGKELSSPNNPQNGRLQILGAANGMFAHIDYEPNIKERDFYIFPYDMRHCVYPFTGSETRRTLAANCDVFYNSLKSRGVN